MEGGTPAHTLLVGCKFTLNFDSDGVSKLSYTEVRSGLRGVEFDPEGVPGASPESFDADRPARELSGTAAEAKGKYAIVCFGKVVSSRDIFTTHKVSQRSES